MLANAAANLHAKSHFRLQSHQEFFKIHNSAFKWVYLWRCGQDWEPEENHYYNQSSLSCLNKEELLYLPSFWTHVFPITC